MSLCKTIMLVGLALLVLFPAPVRCEQQHIPLDVIIQPDPHLAFARELVRAALDAAAFPAAFVDAPLCNEHRKIALLKQGLTHIDLMPATPARLKLAQKGELLMLAVPLDRGLLGYRLNLLLEKKRSLLKNVRSVQDLRRFTMGQGEGWMDVEIYRAAGIPTKEVTAWRNAEFVEQMRAGYFELFPLGLEEALHYFLPHFQKYQPQLMADPYILVRYPWFRFVWVSPKAPNAAQLYEALEKGFGIIADNGVFLEVYSEHKAALDSAVIQKRRVVELTNPFYDDSLVGPPFRHLLFRPAE